MAARLGDTYFLYLVHWTTDSEADIKEIQNPHTAIFLNENDKSGSTITPVSPCDVNRQTASALLGGRPPLINKDEPSLTKF